MSEHIVFTCDMWYLSVFSPNTGKCGTEKLWIRTLITQCTLLRKVTSLRYPWGGSYDRLIRNGENLLNLLQACCTNFILFPRFYEFPENDFKLNRFVLCGHIIPTITCNINVSFTNRNTNRDMKSLFVSNSFNHSFLYPRTARGGSFLSYFDKSITSQPFGGLRTTLYLIST